MAYDVAMKLHLVPARHGALWVRSAFAVFFKRPLLFAAPFTGVMFVGLHALLPAFIGEFLLLAAMPLVSLGFMVATRRLMLGKLPGPGVFVEPLAESRTKRMALVQMDGRHRCDRKLPDHEAERHRRWRPLRSAAGGDCLGRQERRGRNDRRAHLDRQRLPQLQLPDRLPRNRRGPGHRPAGPREVPAGRQGARLADHAAAQHPRAPRPHRRQRGGRRGHRRQGDRAPQGRRQDPGMDRGVKAGDIIKVGKTVELECLDTPGHTMCHICLRSHTEQPALFSGDTLFNAGAGNCHNGGNPRTCMPPSPSSCPSCRTTRRSTPATTTSRTT
jgi:hypothetical protein